MLLLTTKISFSTTGHFHERHSSAHYTHR